MSVKEKLTGVYPPIMSPFAENGKLELGDLAFNIEKMNSTGVRGYMPLGSNGEFRSLSDEEALEVLKTIVKVKGPDKVLMAGTGRESAYSTIEFTKKAAGVGADFASVLTPHYYVKKMNDEALIKYFSQVADASPIPILIYCAPGFAAGVIISPAAISELAKHPNIVGMKDTSKEDIAGYIKAVPKDSGFYVLAGSITKFLTGLKNGAIGGVLSISNYFPEQCCEVQTLFQAGKLDEAEKLSAKLISLTDRATGKHSVSGVKAAMNLVGYKGGYPRVPVLPLKPAELEELKSILKEEGYLK
ncbi:MAG: dihydrodipicolinate synthase family protein [Treponema sp.]|jgi:4-hydroxy-2-oxoglutarate aldolase|nr:dihydrodipicolinate synthase family protein [Treponema sp.]